MKGGPKFEEGVVVGGDYPFGSGSRWRLSVWEWQ